MTAHAPFIFPLPAGALSSAEGFEAAEQELRAARRELDLALAAGGLRRAAAAIARLPRGSRIALFLEPSRYANVDTTLWIPSGTLLAHHQAYLEFKSGQFAKGAPAMMDLVDLEGPKADIFAFPWLQPALSTTLEAAKIIEQCLVDIRQAACHAPAKRPPSHVECRVEDISYETLASKLELDSLVAFAESRTLSAETAHPIHHQRIPGRAL